MPFNVRDFHEAFGRLQVHGADLARGGAPHQQRLAGDLAIVLEVVYTFFRQSEELNHQLHNILERMNAMAGELDTLTAQVASNTTVIDSAVQLLQGLKAALDAAIAANNAGNPTALLALSQSLGTEDEKLAAAVAANTPVAVPPVPPPAPPPVPGPAPGGSGTSG